MRIVNLISGKDLGGSKQAFVHYSDHLRHLGHEVMSVVRPGAQVVTLLDQRQLPWQYLNYPRTRCPGLKQLAQRHLGRWLQQHPTDVVIVHKPIDAALIKPVLTSSCKLVLVLHSFTKQHLNAADYVLPVSQPLHDFMRQQGGTLPAMVMPNLVEMSAHAQPSQSIRQQGQPLRIAHMGVMRRTKGQDLLIEAFALLVQQALVFNATLAGKGRWFKKIQQLIAQHQLQDKVAMQGWVANSDHQAFFDQADIVCIPSRQETFGMLVIEAMAQKKVVIATRCGGPETIITDGENGLLADISATSLAKKIQQAAAMSSEDFMAMADNAYQHVQDTYSEAPFRARLANMIDWLQNS